MDLSAIFAVLVTWPYALILLGILLVAAVYTLGVRRMIQANVTGRLHWWNCCAFAAGLLVVLSALHPQMNYLAHQWFWVHMLQNESLALVGSLLLILGMPAWALWYALPQQVRGPLLRWALQQVWPRALSHGIGRWILGPWVLLVIYVASFSMWHVPPLYDAALVHSLLYAVELGMFLVTGLLLWAQVIPWRPEAQARLNPVPSMIFLVLVGMHSNLLGSLYMFSTVPFYPYYMALHSTAGAALVDQHLAGAAMDVPGTLLLWGALSVLLWIWLSEDERAGQTAATPTSPATKP
jgi:cytochrome c oxidase assembly factor CtaG